VKRVGGDDETPKLPRGRWFGSLRTIELIRIGMVATVLVVVIVLGRPCADGIARFVESYAPPPDAGPPAVQYERLTEEEIRKRFPGGDQLDADDKPPAPAPGKAPPPAPP
jgi:hypothetical protein